MTQLLILKYTFKWVRSGRWCIVVGIHKVFSCFKYLNVGMEGRIQSPVLFPVWIIIRSIYSLSKYHCCSHCLKMESILVWWLIKNGSLSEGATSDIVPACIRFDLITLSKLPIPAIMYTYIYMIKLLIKETLNLTVINIHI